MKLLFTEQENISENNFLVKIDQKENNVLK